jgi:hypothetical protein
VPTVNPEKKKLKALHDHCHAVLRRLKMDETGVIPVTSEHSAEAIINYVLGYSFHKRKWFETKNDKTARVVYAERKPPPPWEKEYEEDDEEEI